MKSTLFIDFLKFGYIIKCNTITVVSILMRAILFDISGTILDTKEHVYRQFEELTRRVDGAPASRPEIAAAMQGTLDDVIRTLVKNPAHSHEELLDHHDKAYVETMEHLKLYPGVDELLPILRRVGFRVAGVVSGDDRIIEALESTGVRHYFDIVVTPKHVRNARPHPDSVHYALKHIGIDPEAAIIVTDSPEDVLAGRKAGVGKTIAVLHGLEAAEVLKNADPDYFVDDIPSILDVVE